MLSRLARRPSVSDGDDRRRPLLTTEWGVPDDPLLDEADDHTHSAWAQRGDGRAGDAQGPRLYPQHGAGGRRAVGPHAQHARRSMPPARMPPARSLASRDLKARRKKYARLSREEEIRQFRGQVSTVCTSMELDIERLFSALQTAFDGAAGCAPDASSPPPHHPASDVDDGGLRNVVRGQADGAGRERLLGKWSFKTYYDVLVAESLPDTLDAEPSFLTGGASPEGGSARISHGQTTTPAASPLPRNRISGHGSTFSGGKGGPQSGEVWENDGEVPVQHCAAAGQSDELNGATARRATAPEARIKDTLRRRLTREGPSETATRHSEEEEERDTDRSGKDTEASLSTRAGGRGREGSWESPRGVEEEEEEEGEEEEEEEEQNKSQPETSRCAGGKGEGHARRREVGRARGCGGAMLDEMMHVATATPSAPQPFLAASAASGLSHLAAKHVFFFEYGCLVCWGLSAAEESFFTNFMREFEEASLRVDEQERDDMTFFYAPPNASGTFSFVSFARARARALSLSLHTHRHTQGK